jgi:hypothetical protein
MTKTESLIQKYKDAYHALHGKLPKIIKKGAWIYINESPTAHRSGELTNMIDRLIAMKDMADKLDKKGEPEPDIRELILAIIQDGKNIYHKKITRGSDIKQVKEAGRTIAKKAKRVLNIMDKEGM